MLSKLTLFLTFLWFGTASAQCGAGEAKLDVSIRFDSSPEQNTAELTDVQTTTVENLPIAQVANTLVDSTRCVTADTLYKFEFKDSGGNGLTGGGYASVSINGKLIASLSDFGSSAVYYFSADSYDCGTGKTRWALNLKYDTNPTGVSAALTADGSLIFSLDGLNSADLAGQFLYADKCISVGPHAFSITAVGGISTPGFYRIFNEYTLLAVGGGDNGFQGTESTTFTVTDGPVPTPAPTLDVCEDAWEEKFVDKDGGLQNCIWLAERNDTEFDAHCGPSQPAWSLCRETCGACTENPPCADVDDVKFELLGSTGRDCTYVRVRLSANYDKNFPLFCAPDTMAYEYCKDSCDNCVAVPTDPTDPPDPGMTTPAPSPDPMLTDPCDDSGEMKIFLNATIGEVSCHWLKTHPDEQATYCAIGQISNAYNVCEETCGKCTDNCEDDDDATFTDDTGDTQNCNWLAESLATLRPIYCFPGADAWDKCKESCGNCNSVNSV